VKSKLSRRKEREIPSLVKEVGQLLGLGDLVKPQAMNLA